MAPPSFLDLDVGKLDCLIHQWRKHLHKFSNTDSQIYIELGIGCSVCLGLKKRKVIQMLIEPLVLIIFYNNADYIAKTSRADEMSARSL